MLLSATIGKWKQSTSAVVAEWEHEDWNVGEIMNGGSGMHDVATPEQQNAEWRSIWFNRIKDAIVANDEPAAIHARDMWRKYK